jgi:SAM-dependent methyltransferase
MIPVCNICSCQVFTFFNGREAQCTECLSLERHRLMKDAILHYGLTTGHVLHLAPEIPLVRFLKSSLLESYYCADANPSMYPYIRCHQLSLPKGLEELPAEHFDLIIHNHVLEHIVGPYQEHLHSLIRVLKKNGKMLFTVPLNKSPGSITIEGGQYLTDEERLRQFGQHDHVKAFGIDFLDYCKTLPGTFITFNVSAARAAELKTLELPDIAWDIYVFTRQ